MLTNKITYGQDKTVVEVNYGFVGSDLQVVITAGKAHVGATAFAVPCQTTAEGVTASVSVMTAPGHRDDVVAGKSALELCKAMRCNVCVTAGLHIDHASQDEIMTLVNNTKESINILIKKLKEE